MIYASGILFISNAGNALFLKRSADGDHAGEWCFPGGKIETGESAEQAAVRECVEEIGQCPDGKRFEHSVVTQNLPGIQTSLTGETAPGAVAEAVPIAAMAPEPVTFTTYVQRVEEEFVPVLNGEHTGYAWSPVFDAPQPLHPGCAISIAKFNWHELDVARAMVRGDLASPQQYENVALFLVRITGTGNSYRGALKEHVIRKPEEYLTQDFLDRCQGLTVVMMHPARKMLDSKEFQDRVVGNIICPFIRGDEVWGVAKIYDDATADLMARHKLSTSPGVVFRNPAAINRLTLEDGIKLSIEGAPSLLDHLAVCEVGVWDKGEEPNGIEVLEITATGDCQMDKDDKKDAAKVDATKVDATKVDATAKADDAVPSQVVTMLDSVMGKVSSMCDAVMGRMDGMEENFKKDAAIRADAAKKADADKDDDKKDDAAKKADDDKDDDKDDKKDADDKDDEKKSDAKKADAKKADADKEEDKKDDSVKADDDVRAKIADMAKRMDSFTPRSDADEDAMADVQAKFDSVYSEHGTKAPRPLHGEQKVGYTRRLLRGIQSHSPAWSKVDLALISVDSAALAVAETQIIADAQKAARNPASIAAGSLRERVRVGDGGHRIKSFEGDPRSWMASFSAQRQKATLVKPRDLVH